MQYQVPQFIEVEDKIFGPLTFKQFLYIVGGGAVCYVLWTIIPIKFLAILVVFPVAVMFLMLAFYKVNGRPLIHTLEKGLYFIFSNKLYIWKKIDKPMEQNPKEISVAEQMNVPKISDSRLKELTWSLDINSKLETTKSKDALDLKI